MGAQLIIASVSSSSSSPRPLYDFWPAVYMTERAAGHMVNIVVVAPPVRYGTTTVWGQIERGLGKKKKKRQPTTGRHRDWTPHHIKIVHGCSRLLKRKGKNRTIWIYMPFKRKPLLLLLPIFMIIIFSKKWKTCRPYRQALFLSASHQVFDTETSF